MTECDQNSDHTPQSYHYHYSAENMVVFEKGIGEGRKKSYLLKDIENGKGVWELPSQVHTFVERKELLEQLRTLGLLPPHDSTSKIVTETSERVFVFNAFRGLGGVGKTQLALQYIHHPGRTYNLRAWFVAENIAQLMQEYIKFAKALGYESQSDKPNFEGALIYIKQCLKENPGWLLVYDNVNNYNEIKDFLPESTSNSHVILTTRCQNWPNTFKTLDVNVMTESESIEFMLSLIKKEVKDKERKSLQKLVKLLGYLPLALAQAGAYIHQTSMSISEYLKLYEEHEPDLLADEIRPEGTNSLPVAVTWNITLKVLAKESPLSLPLLTACAYLAPDNIPRDLLLIWLKENYPQVRSPELELPKLIAKLWQYSMIIKNGSEEISIHRLVQTVMRHQQQVVGNNYYPIFTLEWYELLLKSAYEQARYEVQRILQNEGGIKTLLPHLQALVEHCDKQWPGVVNLRLSEVMNVIGDIFLDRIDRKATYYYKRALKIKEHIYGKDHIKVAITCECLGTAYYWEGKAKKAKEFYERALTIKELIYGHNHIEVAMTLRSLGEAYRDLGEAKEAKRRLEETLKIQERTTLKTILR